MKWEQGLMGDESGSSSTESGLWDIRSGVLCTMILAGL